MNIIKPIAIGVVSLFVLILILMSWVDVEPGQEGFAYRPYSGGVDVESNYTEGTYFVAPWNDIITYNILQESKSYQSTVMDVNGTDISVEVAVNFSVQKGSASKLHLKH